MALEPGRVTIAVVALALALRLRICDLSVGAGALVYHGALVAVPALNLGFLSTGADRRAREGGEDEPGPGRTGPLAGLPQLFF